LEIKNLPSGINFGFNPICILCLIKVGQWILEFIWQWFMCAKLNQVTLSSS
jgi:hypothetical protein